MRLIASDNILLTQWSSVHYKLTVKGRVQGVGYRALAKSIAKELGVAGFVKNLDDGSVEIQCDCDEKTLEKFLNALEQKSESFIGPHVEKIHVQKLSGAKKGFKGFEIVFSD